MSRRERQILDILLELGEATAGAVRDRLPSAPSYSAVRTMLGRLEEKAYITHSVDGARYVYRPAVDAAAERGDHVVLDIDVQGARQIRSSVPDAKLIFVLPPSVDIMMARLTGRGTEEPENVARRLESAVDELQAVPEFDYVVVNDDLDECLSEIRGIVERDEAPAPPEQDAEDMRRGIVALLEGEYSAYRQDSD